MSRRRSGSIMGPPPDRDVIMGPPPVPAPSSQQAGQHAALPPPQASHHTPKGDQDITEKYKKLKRRYFELEEVSIVKHKEAATELARSGERNVKMRGERDILLDRIMELEGQTLGPPPNAPASRDLLHSGAFPKSLLDATARTAFANNLRQVMNEVEAADIDPALSLRHMEEHKRRAEGSKDHRRHHQLQNPYPAPVAQPVATYKGKEIPGLPQQGLLTFSPAPGEAPHTSTQPIMRVNPTAHPDSRHPNNAPPPSQLYNSYGQPMSPMVSPHEERASYSPNQYRNGHLPPNPRRDSGSSLSNSPPITQLAYGQDGHGQHPLQRAPTPSGSTGPDGARQGKPKRLKAHTVTSKSFSVPIVPRGKKGQPMLPLNVGIMTLINLGEVCMREHFHTERYIYPVGYEVTRRYLSTVDPNIEVVYNCTILDGGDGPKFQIVPSDAPERVVISGTATGAWSNIVKLANTIRNRQHSNSVSGPDFFGLGQNTIKHLIQHLPGADRLRDYVWQNFVEGGCVTSSDLAAVRASTNAQIRPLGGRHAAVIPALPEDYQEQGSLAAHHPDVQVREQRRRASMSGEKEELPSPPIAPQRRVSPPTQASLQTIILPAPTTGETLTIQEYQPEREKRAPRSRKSPIAGTQGRHKGIVGPASRSPSAQPPGQMSTLVLVPTPQPPPPAQASTLVETGQRHSPYMPDRPTPAGVPTSFASIMNAYPGQPIHANGSNKGD
ncbi:hypothetical protein HWV62_37476 [Athelia sp. TMB]|nr:hypothetical protein HWV62_37476 [Athelia sp. TMB]